MFINFINPMYPAQDIMSGSCNFRVVVSNPSVCQVTIANWILVLLLTMGNYLKYSKTNYKASDCPFPIPFRYSCAWIS